MDFPHRSLKTRSPERDPWLTSRKSGGRDASISSIWRLLVNCPDQYLTARNGGWYLAKRPLTNRLLAAALCGRASVGLPSVSADGLSLWTAWDLDDDQLLQNLHQLAAYLAPQGHILLEQSNRGAHLFAFHPPTDWRHAHAYGVKLADKFGLDGVEVFPKHGGLNCLRMPGSRHPKTGRAYQVIDPTTGELMAAITALVRITPVTIPQDVLPEAPQPLQKGRSVFTGTSDFIDLVQALEQLTHVKVYGPEKGIACCPWHKDQHPSLFIKGRRFHCLSSRCGVFGDAFDVGRWIKDGTPPPKG